MLARFFGSQLDHVDWQRVESDVSLELQEEKTEVVDVLELASIRKLTVNSWVHPIDQFDMQGEEKISWWPGEQSRAFLSTPPHKIYAPPAISGKKMVSISQKRCVFRQHQQLAQGGTPPDLFAQRAHVAIILPPVFAWLSSNSSSISSTSAICARSPHTAITPKLSSTCQLQQLALKGQRGVLNACTADFHRGRDAKDKKVEEKRKRSEGRPNGTGNKRFSTRQIGLMEKDREKMEEQEFGGKVSSSEAESSDDGENATGSVESESPPQEYECERRSDGVPCGDNSEVWEGTVCVAECEKDKESNE
ncbi:hypothetical protein BT69DRAFT_1294239 [Atractiella rhizophila]|nr:hypothetical protein BT69DRAFT_1294239 [Atractiella rhizophila]